MKIPLHFTISLLIIHLIIGLFFPFQGYDQKVMRDGIHGMADFQASMAFVILFVVPNFTVSTILFFTVLRKKEKDKLKKFFLSILALLSMINIVFYYQIETKGIEIFLKLNGQHPPSKIVSANKAVERNAEPLRSQHPSH